MQISSCAQKIHKIEDLVEHDSTTFNIQITAKMTGVNPHTIRAWEKRYKAITPKRDEKGRRIYTKAEVTRLALLNELVYNGHSISSVANLPDSDLQSMHYNLFNQNFHFKEYQFKSNLEVFDIQECLQSLTFALISNSFNIVNHELDKARTALEGHSFVQNITTPFLCEVKALSIDNRLDAYEFEMLLAIVRSHLQVKVSSTQAASDKQIEVLIVNAPQLQSEILALESALAINYKKFSYQLIGNQIGPEALASLAQQYKSISILYAQNVKESISNTKTDTQENVYNYFSRLNKLIDSDVEVWTIGSSKTIFDNSICLTNINELIERLKCHAPFVSQ